jgi:error-prone DNA polymerase
VIHVIAHHLVDATHDLHRLSVDLMPVPIAHADHCNNPLPSRWGQHGGLQDAEPAGAESWSASDPNDRDCSFHVPISRGHPREVRIVPKLLPLPPSRDFH